MATIPAPLANKSALVTGGSRNIGAGIARKLVQQGCTHIAITYDTNATQAASTLAELRALAPGLHAHAFPANLLDPDFGESVIAQARQGLNIECLDIVVACAANLDIDTFSPVASMAKSEWDEIMTTNAWAPLALAREAVKCMNPGGRIVFVSSVSSKMGQGDPFVGYAASKAALDSLSRNLAVLWGAKYGVTVNSVSVGATRTDMLERSIARRGEEFERGVAEFSLLKRVGEIEEVAAIVAFVASPEASWIVGNQVPANGGGLSIMQS